MLCRSSRFSFTLPEEVDTSFVLSVAVSRVGKVESTYIIEFMENLTVFRRRAVAAVFQFQRIGENRISLLGRLHRVECNPLSANIAVEVGNISAAPFGIFLNAVLRLLIDADLLAVAFDSLIILELVEFNISSFPL